MSGQLIGALTLWLIVAIIVIAIVVYLVNWLYRRSSKEAADVPNCSRQISRPQCCPGASACSWLEAPHMPSE